MILNFDLHFLIPADLSLGEFRKLRKFIGCDRGQRCKSKNNLHALRVGSSSSTFVVWLVGC